jgi:hypothetical protein
MEKKLTWFTSSCVEFLPPEAAPSQKLPVHTHGVTIWPAMQNGITNYWDVHTIQHNKFYFSFVSGKDPTTGLADGLISPESRIRPIRFKYNIQMGILFHTLLDKASYSLILSQPCR